MKKYISLFLIFTLLVSVLAGAVAFAVNGENEAAGETAAEKTPAEGEAKKEVITPEMKDAYMESVKQKAPDNTTIDDAFELIDENENLALYAITNNDELRIGEILILDKKDGYVWRSNPADQNEDMIGKTSDAYNMTKSQLVFTYGKGYNKQDTNSYRESVAYNLVECKIENGTVTFTYRFNELQFVIPVRYSLNEEGLKAELVINSEEGAVFTYITQGSDGVGHLGEKVIRDIEYNITDLKLLPAFGATSFNESGYLFIPDGSGALVYMNNGRTNISQPYSAPVYGNYKESKVADYNAMASDRYMLPVFGTVKDDKHALMGVIDNNASVAYIHAEISGAKTAYNKVYPSYLHKLIGAQDKKGVQQPKSKENRDTTKNFSVNYYCLSGDEASYVGMAKRYREYLIEEKGMKKADDYREGALLLDMYAGVEKKTSILGIPWNKFEVMTTYEDIIRISNDMSDAGIDNVIFKYNDWIKKSGRKKIQVKPTFEGSIGGKKGYEKAMNHLSGKNMSFYMNIDFINYSESGNGYSKNTDSVKETTQAPAYQMSGMSAHINMGGRWLLLKAPLVKEAALKFADKCAENKITSVSIENIGDTIYADGANKNGHTRGESMNQFSEIIAQYKEKGLNVLTSKPSEYAVVNSDILMDIPSKDTYIEIADEAVPFYQIVVRGYKTYTTEDVNMSSNPENVILNAVESGSSLLYSFVAGDTTGLKETYLKYLYSSNYGQWKDDMIESYKKYEVVMDKVKGADIDNHEKLAKDVYVTTFSNGVKVYVNYSKQAYNADGVEIPARGFISEGGEQA